jgi:HK97 family phage portal protein
LSPDIWPFRRKALTASPEVVEAIRDRRTNFYVRLGGTNQNVSAAFWRGQQASYGWLYANRPAVRTVVDYLARNVAQLPLKLYERLEDNERERRYDHPAAETMGNPDGHTPADQFIFRFVADFLVYDNAYLLKFRANNTQKLTLVRVPPASVTVHGGRFTPELYRVWRTDGSSFDVKPADILHWHGYNPEDPLLGVSKLETLRQTLTEDSVSQTTSVELMRNGLVAGHIRRPLDAPEWDETDISRFREGWADARASGGKKTPVLEDGMEFVKDGMSPKDAEMLEGRKFTVAEVARVYGVPPGVLGLEPSADLEEQRTQVYADVLPPITGSLACQLDVDILQVEYDERDYYYEFDLNAKLRGDPVKRYQALTAAVGGPWMLREEARAKENLPPVEGGDQLITPLNVLVGANPKPAPNVMGPQDVNKPPQDGSHREAPKAVEPGGFVDAKAYEQVSQLVDRFKADLERQHAYITEVHGALTRYYGRQLREFQRKAHTRFDTDRWNRELGFRLDELLAGIIGRETAVYMRRLAGGEFDMAQVTNYIAATAKGVAEAINHATQLDIDTAGVEQAFARARNERAEVASASIGSRSAIFARYEAAKQAPTPELRTKTWVADTKRHAEVNGETVALSDSFSIGFEPGSAPNCRCSLVIS